MTAFILIAIGCWFIASGTLGAALVASGPADWLVHTAGRISLLTGGLFLAIGWYA